MAGNSINLPPSAGAAAGVSTLNTLTGAITIVEGANVTVGTVGSSIVIAAAVSAVTSLTGDATGTGPGATAVTLATVNSNVGTFGASTAIPVVTVNAKGLVTAASTAVVVAPAGTLSGTTLNATVVNSSLQNLGTQSQALNMGGFKIDAVANPTLAQDAATKFYVDSLVSGLTWKPPVAAFSNVNVPLTGGASLTIDSYSVQNGDSVLLSNQTVPTQNGVYTVAGIGTTYALTIRDTAIVGDAYLVTAGTVFGGQAFVVTAITPTIYTQFVSPTNYSFTAPLSAAGNVVSLTRTNLTAAGTDGIAVTGGTNAVVGSGTSIAQAAASGSQNGYLTSANWTTFNAKQSALTFSQSLVNSAGTVTLVNDASSPGADQYYGTNGVSTKGWFTLPSIGTAITALTGDVTATGPGSAVATLAATSNATLVTLSGLTTASSLVSVGTITTGTWHGTAVDATHGGTAQSTYTTGDLLYASGTNTLAKLAIGSSTNVLTVTGGVPAWAAAAGGSGITALTGDVTASGTGSVVATLAATSNATLVTLSGLTTASSLVSVGTITTGTWHGTAVDATHGGTAQSTYTTGDLLYASGTNTLAKLAIGSSTNVLTVTGGVPAWAAAAGGSGITALTGDVTASGTGSVVATLAATSNATLVTLSGLTTASSLVSVGTITTGTWQGTAVDATHGGTAQSTYTTGDLLYASGTNTLAKLAIGSSTNVLTVTGGVPAWAAAAGGTAASQNLMPNGAADWWQSLLSGATSVTAANGAQAYGPDLFFINNALGSVGVLTCSQQTPDLAGSLVNTEVQISTAPTSGQTNGCEIYYVWDTPDAAMLWGNTLYFSVSVKGMNNVNQVGVQFFSNSGRAKPYSGNSGSAAIGSEVLTSVNTSTYTSCTIHGQALSSSPGGASVLGVRIRITGVVSGNTYDHLNGFKFEQAFANLGSLGMFSRTTGMVTNELAACQKLYETSYDVTTQRGGAAGTIGSVPSGAGANGECVQPTQQVGAAADTAFGTRFKVAKNVTPNSVVWYASRTTGAPSINTMWNFTSAAAVAATASAISTTGFNTVFSTGTTALYAGLYVCDARV